AIELYTRLLHTLLLVVVVVLAVALVFRWLLLSRRALAVAQARERRRLMKEQGMEPGATEIEQKAVDLAAVDQQTRSLLHAAGWFVLLVGAWGIWVDVLPALGILREVELWDEVVQISEIERAAD